MDRPSPRLPDHRRRSKRPNPVPRVLLILLLFALPLVLIPSVLDGLGPVEPVSRPSARDELNRVLAQEGIVLGQETGVSNAEAADEVAGAFVEPSAFSPPPAEPAGANGHV